MFISPNLQVTLMYLDAVLSTCVLQLCVWRTVGTWPRWATEHLAMGLTKFIECSRQWVKTEPALMSPQDPATWSPDCEQSPAPSSHPCGSLSVPQEPAGDWRKEDHRHLALTRAPFAFVGCISFLREGARCKPFQYLFTSPNAISCLRLHLLPQLELGSPSFIFAGKSKLQQNQRRRQSERESDGIRESLFCRCHSLESGENHGMKNWGAATSHYLRLAPLRLFINSRSNFLVQPRHLSVTESWEELTSWAPTLMQGEGHGIRYYYSGPARWTWI